MCTCMYICSYMCICMYVYVYIYNKNTECMCVYIYVCINIATWLLFEHYNKLYSFESQDVLGYVYVRLKNDVKSYWLCA